jgi:hypothetical protein
MYRKFTEMYTSKEILRDVYMYRKFTEMYTSKKILRVAYMYRKFTELHTCTKRTESCTHVQKEQRVAYMYRKFTELHTCTRRTESYIQEVLQNFTQLQSFQSCIHVTGSSQTYIQRDFKLAHIWSNTRVNRFIPAKKFTEKNITLGTETECKSILLKANVTVRK